MSLWPFVLKSTHLRKVNYLTDHIVKLKNERRDRLDDNGPDVKTAPYIRPNWDDKEYRILKDIPEARLCSGDHVWVTSSDSVVIRDPYGIGNTVVMKLWVTRDDHYFARVSHHDLEEIT